MAAQGVRGRPRLCEIMCSRSIIRSIDQKFSPAWPAYVFAGKPLELPIIGGALGHGARAHSPNEYYVIEGANGRYGRVYGLAGAEKSMATILYNYAGKRLGRIPTRLFREVK